MTDPSAPQHLVPTPYGSYSAAYLANGWAGVLPLPERQKTPPPAGFTGWNHPQPEGGQVISWSANRPTSNIALRLPADMIGIDVDDYEQKHGAGAFDALEKQLGKLPPTWSSTSRGVDSRARIYLYRLPHPARVRGGAGADIDVIQHGHRYVIAAPSIHPSGQTYAWYAPSGALAEIWPPPPNAMPILPQAWFEWLQEGASTSSTVAADEGAGRRMLDNIRESDEPACEHMAAAWHTGFMEFQHIGEGGRHDAMLGAVMRVVMAGADGHPGADTVLTELEIIWIDACGGERQSEFDRMLTGAARKAVTEHGGWEPSTFHECESRAEGVSILADRAQPTGAPTQAPDATPALAPPAYPQLGSFQPAARDDQSLASAVREHVAPIALYATDAGTWIQHEGLKWATSRMDGAGAVSIAADHMPLGDKEAEKGTPENDAHLLRQRFRSSAQSSGVSGKLNAILKARTPGPLTQVAQLDREPNILWAGGWPFDLKQSGDGPKLADLDPRTPHLKSAAYVPADRETPLWDHYLDIVLPDPAARAWVLQVLAVCLTGHAESVMPVLYGDPGSGKSSLVKAIMTVMGNYAGPVDSRLLKDNAPGHVVASLNGLRLAFMDEAPPNGFANTEQLKLITGGVSLTGDRKYENSVTFSPTHTLVATTNPAPNLGRDAAVARRARVMRMDAEERHVREALTLMGRTEDPLAAFHLEAPGILAKLMRGSAVWLADNSVIAHDRAPFDWQAADADMASAQNPVMRWVLEMTSPDPIGIKAPDAHQLFAMWCQDHPEFKRQTILSPVDFGRKLTKAGVTVEHRRDGNYRLIRLGGPGGGGLGPVKDDGPGTGHGNLHTSFTGHSEVTNVTATVTREGCGDGYVKDNSAPSFTPETPRDQQVSSSVKDVKDTFLTKKDRLDIKGVEEGDREGIGNRPSHPAHPSQAESRPISGVSDIGLGHCPECDTAAALTKAGAFRVHKNGTGFKCEGSGKADQARREAIKAEKAAERAAVKATKIRELEGELYTLPVAVGRDGVIHEVTPEVASQLLVSIMARSGYLTVDVESTGMPVWHPEYSVRTAQLGDRHLALDFDTDDPAQCEVVAWAMREAPSLSAHNAAAADIAPLVGLGLCDYDQAMGKMIDTALLSKLADPRLTDSSADLKGVAAAVLPDAVSTGANAARKALFEGAGWLTDIKWDSEVERSGWAQVQRNSATMIRYACADVLDGSALREDLPYPAPEVLERERVLGQVCGRISLKQVGGFKLDADLVNAQIAERQPRFDALKAGIIRDFGVDPASPAQLVKWFEDHGVTLPRTGTGGPSTDKSALETLKHAQWPVGELAGLTLAYRADATLLQNMLRPWEASVRYGDGRAYTTIYTLGTDTGRMSSVRQNFQQIAKKGGLRECATVDNEFWKIIAADFSAVEVRALAALSGDQNLINMIVGSLTCPRCLANETCTDHDLHARTAWMTFGEDWTKAQRQTCKILVFGRLYGGGEDTLAKQTGVSVETVRRILAMLDQLTPGVTAWTNQVKAAVKAGHTTFETYSGRVIHLDPAFPHKAVNYLVQGTARELLADALIEWSRGRWATCVVLPMHDEIVAWVPAAEADEAIAFLAEIMTRKLWCGLQEVPIACEADAPAMAWQSAT